MFLDLLIYLGIVPKYIIWVHQSFSLKADPFKILKTISCSSCNSTF